MQPTNAHDEVTIHLAKLGAMYVYVFEYRITHGYMHLALTGSSFHDRRADVYLGDCSFIHGPTEGGPWTLEVMESIDDAGHPMLEFRSTCGSFLVHCLRASISLLREARSAE